MNNPSRRASILIYIILFAAALILLLGLFGGDSLPEVDYAEMRSLFLNGEVSSFEWDDGVLTMELQKDNSLGPEKVCHNLADLDMFREDLHEVYEQQYADGTLKDYNFVPLEPTPWYLQILPYVLILVVTIAVMFFLTARANGGNGAMKFGKANIRVGPGENKVTFADVAGAEEEKAELQEIVDFLRNPQKYRAIGAKIPKGVLLVGPPGTGKTLIAKAVAGEANVQFLSISGSDFVELYVGVGASRVRDLFEQAKKRRPLHHLHRRNRRRRPSQRCRSRRRTR